MNRRPARWIVFAGLFFSAACGDGGAGGGSGVPCGDAGATAPLEGAPFHIVSWNIGNGSSQYPRYALRMTDERYAEFVAERLRTVDADIYLFQEVLPPNVCEGEPETDPRFTCYAPDPARPLARRLLGPDYTIACDARRHIECIAVHTRFGTIRGLAPGAFSVDGAETPPLPFPGCDYTGNTCVERGDLCDVEATVSTVLVDTAALGALRVVHVHPAAIGTRCRNEEIKQAFGYLGAEPTVLGGDWNFQTEAPEDLVDAAIWNAHVGPGQRLSDHHPRNEDCSPVSTRFTGRSLDRVVTDFASGVCRVWADPSLDDGFPLDDSGEMVGDRIDHAAVDCRLVLTPGAPAEEAP